jgi:hypothetical protein
VFTTLAGNRRLFRAWLRFAGAPDMTSRGFGTEAAAKVRMGPRQVAPLELGIDAIERGIARRSHRVVAPGWVAAVLPIRMLAQRVIDRYTLPGLEDALATARGEHAPLTTEMPEVHSAPASIST